MTQLAIAQKLSWIEKSLIAIFLLTLPFVNPWVRGDGVGYYAYARAMLIEHSLDFRNDWKAANSSFTMDRLDSQGNVLPEFITTSGHIENHFTVGPAILWAPFLIVAHGCVLLADRFGARIPADGFSWPYLYSMAFATAMYGFLALWISFRLASRYFGEHAAAVAVVGIWFASSLPVYMYFNPSWSHAHSAFIVAIFLWYWLRTRTARSWNQWMALGFLAGLAADVYYPNILLLIAPAVESLWEISDSIHTSHADRRIGRIVLSNLILAIATVVALLPTFITRDLIYGSPFATGYFSLSTWTWFQPELLGVLFSSDHGCILWTPILAPSIIGLWFLLRRDRVVGTATTAITIAYYYVVASYPAWDGLSSFGMRYFIPLTPIFILGLAGAFSALDSVWPAVRARAVAYFATAALVVWNLAFIYQWGMHLVPARGPISWHDMVHNQFVVVPERMATDLGQYFTHRKTLMKHIETIDVDQLKRQGAAEQKENR